MCCCAGVCLWHFTETMIFEADLIIRKTKEEGRKKRKENLI